MPMHDPHDRDRTAVALRIDRRRSALLAAVVARPLGAQGSGAANEFNDSHFHLTNYIQEGITPREFLQIMGTRVGRSTLFGIPLQQQWSYANSGDFAPTYYLQTDAPLYYYSFTDAYIASVYRVADAGRAGALRSDDHRLQSGRHVRRRSHPPRAADVSRRVLGHRRVHHPQGVRLVEDRRRDGQPDEPGARSHSRLRGRSRARR